jgi:two-component system response regulator NreC
MTSPLELSPCRAVDATASIRVVLADDHELMRERLRALLEEDGRFLVIAETADLGEAIGYVLRARPDVLVLDLSMPTGSSIAAIRRIRTEAPLTHIVVMKMEASAAFARHSFAAGASAYVLKDTADAELAEAVGLAAAGRRYVSPRVLGALGG